MLSFFFGFLNTPVFWFLALAVVAAGVWVYIRKGPKALFAILGLPHLWIAAALILGGLSVYHLESENKRLEQKVEQQETQSSADTDAQKTTETRTKQKTKRQEQSDRLQDAITHAKPGHAQDDLLDQIASERPDLNGGASSVDGVRKHVDGAVKP